METTQFLTTIESLNVILLKHQIALYNIKEIEDLEAKIICVRTLPCKHTFIQPDKIADESIDSVVEHW